jgi:hypothetical protein
LKKDPIRVYLSGGMEYARNEGSDWREDMSRWVKDNLHQSVFNPNVESDKYLHKVLINKNFRLLKSTDIERYKRIARHFVEQDSREVALRADYVICYWDKSAQRGAGTKGELTIAHYFGKPVYMVTRISCENIPGWVLGCVTESFSSFQQLKDFLKKEFSKKGTH